MGACRVLLINPPNPPSRVANREGAAGLGTLYDEGETFLYPPHTLAATAAGLRAAGHEVLLADLVVAPETSPQAADVIGVFISYATIEDDLHYLRSLPRGVAPVVALGPAMRFLGARVLAAGCTDAVLVGDAEAALPAIVQELARGERRGCVAAHELGLPGFDAEGFVQDLDRLPFPAWDVTPWRKYPLLTVLSSRGCPDRCSYCPYAAAQGHRLRVRSVDNVLSELEWLEERFQPRRVIFRDPVFAYDRARVVALCEGILQRGLQIKWECESRPEHFDPELLDLVKVAGCQWVKIGVETTDPSLLVRLGRISSPQDAGAYLDHVRRMSEHCHAIGLPCRLFAMAGLPAQDEMMARQTAEFLLRSRPLALNVKSFEPYPGLTAVGATPADIAGQLAVLQGAQAAIVRASDKPPLLRRAKRWLRARLYGERR